MENRTEKDKSVDQNPLQPIKLDTNQMEELDRLINSLRKEIVYPKRKVTTKIGEAKSI